MRWHRRKWRRWARWRGFCRTSQRHTDALFSSRCENTLPFATKAWILTARIWCQCNMNVETAIETLFGQLDDGSAEAEAAKADALCSQYKHAATVGETGPARRLVWTPTDASAAAAGGDPGAGGCRCTVLRGGDDIPPLLLGSDAGLEVETVGPEGGGGGEARQGDGLFAALARLADSEVGQIRLGAEVCTGIRSTVFLSGC